MATAINSDPIHTPLTQAEFQSAISSSSIAEPIAIPSQSSVPPMMVSSPPPVSSVLHNTSFASSSHHDSSFTAPLTPTMYPHDTSAGTLESLLEGAFDLHNLSSHSNLFDNSFLQQFDDGKLELFR